MSTGDSDMTIGPAVPGDLPRILEIRYAAFARHAPSAYSPQEVQTLLGDVDPDEIASMITGRTVFVAREAGHTLGCAGWQGERLRHVYVDPRAGRRGIGTALLATVETDFGTRTGRTHLHAGVALHAEGFYRANGYQVLRRARDWDGSSYLEMRKPLP
ncbi:hypothetical protein GCM10010168_23810 [Actinoplanes ianthinogenes]|uniref:N-acetyltransferase domain-containing protein n=1 Tax=Actinoplanes ianthinogenes TaxID=122358 RepID=A0ABM7M8N5_9ACTN|nr:GNAT family N-acetyltransferase [Actinoplanes ianthinogenes]BCJ48022.1 hypothetical protein Aiant_86790 [Actinoplanes ianthinogenes]GGR05825.1 hypothetical protein GCM10010168_23810 [Actinoplanes ianthinogenes]